MNKAEIHSDSDDISDQIEQIQTLSNSERIELAVDLSEDFDGKFDAYKFEKSTELLQSGIPRSELDSHWKETGKGQDANLKALASEMREVHSSHQSTVNELRANIRSVEIELEFLPKELDSLLSLIGESKFKILSLRDVLPDELVPICCCYRTVEYNHDQHVLIYEVLTSIGAEDRKDERIVGNLGSCVAKLFEAEDDNEDECLTFQELRLRADRYLESNPNDPVAILWRCELACWQ